MKIYNEHMLVEDDMRNFFPNIKEPQTAMTTIT